MIQKVLVTPIIGLPQINGWAQVTQSSDGQFISAFSIHGSQAGNVGRDLVDLIKSNPPDTATAVYSLMKRIVRFVAEKDCKIEISSSFFGQSQTIFSAYNGSLLLKRNGKVGKLLQADDEIKIIEGKKTPEDIFVLLTNSSLEFKGEIFQKLSQGLDADTTVASIVPGVQNLDNSSLISMAFLSDLPEGYENDFVGSEQNQEKPVIEFFNNGSDESMEGTEQIYNQPIIEGQAGKKKFNFDKKKLIGILRSILFFLKKILKFIFMEIKKIYRFFRQLFTDKVYIDGNNRATRKRIRVFILGFIGLILIMVPVSVIKFRASAQVKEATTAIESLLVEFESIKPFVEEKPIESREKLAVVVANIEAQEKAFEQKKSGQKYINEKLTIVQDYLDSISGKEVFNELEVFFDFQLVESDFIASRTELVEEIAYFFDKDKKQIIKLELESKKVEVIDFSEQETLKDFAVTSKDIYLLGEGIFERGLSSEDTEKIIDPGKSNEMAKFISIFNNNIYVLNPEQRNIYKYGYDSATLEYSDPIRWVKSAKNLEFEQITSMAVDGDIWLSTKLGQIFKLSGGEGSLFNLNGLIDPLMGQTYLFTQPDYENIYLLEPSSSRLIIVSKSGDFIKEIKSVSLAAASGLVVSESLNKAVVISGSLVFEVGL